MKKSQKPKNEGGITLIALIIMIILLVIIAAITIRAIAGDNRNIGFISPNNRNIHNRTI